MEQEVVPKRGFARFSPEQRKEIAARGGRNVPAGKRGFSQHPDVAAEAGRKGGRNVDPAKRSFSINRELAREAGRKGGRADRKQRDADAPPPPPEITPGPHYEVRDGKLTLAPQRSAGGD